MVFYMPGKVEPEPAHGTDLTPKEIVAELDEVLPVDQPSAGCFRDRDREAFGMLAGNNLIDKQCVAGDLVSITVMN